MPTSAECPRCGARIEREGAPCPHCSETVLSDPGAPNSIVSPLSDAAWAEIAADLSATLEPRTTIVRPIARGGMGMVFLARDVLLDRFVAIKVLAPELAPDESARRRFTFEAQAAAAVGHPNVVAIFSVGETVTQRAPYFVMQYIEGDSVQQRYPAGSPPSVAVGLRIIGEVATALAAAHARHVVHRDIKPSNVMIERESGRAMVVDFGISAGLAPQSAESRLTGTGVYIGTPAFMSPEQAAGQQATERSDVYSLGCLSFEMLTGRPVFDEQSPIAMLAAHLRDVPPSLGALRPDVESGIASLLDRCLAKVPESRPTAAEIVRALLPDGGEEIEWPPPGIPLDALDALRDDRAVAGWMWSGAVAALVATAAAAPVRWHNLVLGVVNVGETLLAVFASAAAFGLGIFSWRLLSLVVARARFRRAASAWSGASGALSVLSALHHNVTRQLLNRRGPFGALDAASARKRLAMLVRLEAQAIRLVAIAPIAWISSLLLFPVTPLLAPIVAVVPLGLWLRARWRIRALCGDPRTARAKSAGKLAPTLATKWQERHGTEMPADGLGTARQALLAALVPVAGSVVFVLAMLGLHTFRNNFIRAQVRQAQWTVSTELGITTRSSFDTSSVFSSQGRLDSLFNITAGPLLSTSIENRRAIRRAYARELTNLRTASWWWKTREWIPGLPAASSALTKANFLTIADDSTVFALVRTPTRASVRAHETLMLRASSQPILDAALAHARYDGASAFWWIDDAEAHALVPDQLGGIPNHLSSRIGRGLAARALVAWARNQPARAVSAVEDHAAFIRASTMSPIASGQSAAQGILYQARAVYDSVANMRSPVLMERMFAARELSRQLRLADRAAEYSFPMLVERGRDEEALELIGDTGLPAYLRSGLILDWRSFACRSPLAPLIGVHPNDAAAAERVYQGLANVDSSGVMRASVANGLRIFNEHPDRDAFARAFGIAPPSPWYERAPLIGPVLARFMSCYRRRDWRYP